jgi:hypothetical protein
MNHEPASSLLGQLQRGLGRGYLAALQDDRSEIHPLLVECITNDPRWDRQIDHRRGYYASLALRTGLSLDPLRDHLERRDDREEATWNSPLTLAVLGDLAKAGVEEAIAILAAYVRVGFWWRDALDELMAAGAADLLPKLEPVVAKRAEKDARDRPDSPEGWARGERRIAEADRIAPNILGPDRREQDLAAMSSAEILAAGELPGTIPAVAEELAEREDEPDVELFLETATAQDAEPWARWVSLEALARQGDPRIVGIIEANLSEKGTPRRVWVASLHAFGLLPSGLTLDRARGWFDDSTEWKRRAAQEVLSKHATLDDAPRLVGAVGPALSEDEGCSELGIGSAYRESLQSFGNTAHPVLVEEMTYSFGRRYVAASLAATDPAFTSGLAVECLWDCEYETRSIGCHAVELRPKPRARLEEMVDDPLEDEEVVEAALQRLARGGPARDVGPD